MKITKTLFTFLCIVYILKMLIRSPYDWAVNILEHEIYSVYKMNIHVVQVGESVGELQYSHCQFG